MRRKVLSVVALLLLAAFALTAFASTHFNRSCSVTGGSAQALSQVLSTCGYSGPVSLNELTIINPDTAANDLYVGQSDVNASTGVKLLPGASLSFDATSPQDTVDAGRLYLFVSSTQNAHLSARSK